MRDKTLKVYICYRWSSYEQITENYGYFASEALALKYMEKIIHDYELNEGKEWYRPLQRYSIGGSHNWDDGDGFGYSIDEIDILSELPEEFKKFHLKKAGMLE